MTESTKDAEDFANRIQASPQPKTPEQTRLAAEAAGRKWLETIVEHSLRGCISSFPQTPPPVMLIEYSRALGTAIGKLFVAQDEIDVHKFRRECKEAFKAGYTAVSPVVATKQ